MLHLEWIVLVLLVAFMYVLFCSLRILNSLFFIKVPEETQKILFENGYPCECRGPIYVKGKGNMTTYLVRPRGYMMPTSASNLSSVGHSTNK